MTAMKCRQTDQQEARCGVARLEAMAENYNAAFASRWPGSRLHVDGGYILGCWYCGTAFKKAELYGMYPPNYLRRVLALFAHVPPDRLLHCPSGLVEGPGVTVDLTQYSDTCPQVIASADELPFEDGWFDLILSDPPYSDKDAKQYGTGHYPLGRSLVEFHRVLAPGGIVGLLHTMQPPARVRAKGVKVGYKLRGFITVLCGFSKRTRLLTLMQKVSST